MLLVVSCLFLPLHYKTSMFKNFDKNTIIGALLIMTMVMVYFKYSTDQAKKRLEKEKLEAKVQRKNAPNIFITYQIILLKYFATSV